MAVTDRFPALAGAALAALLASASTPGAARATDPTPPAAPVPVPDPAPEAEPALALAVGDPAVKWGPCPAFLPSGCELAVLHGDPGRPNADVWLRIPGGAAIVRHWHTSAERMVLVAGELHVAYDGQPAAVLRPGSYAYGPARRVHSARCASTEACVLFIAFEGPVDATTVDDEVVGVAR